MPSKEELKSLQELSLEDKVTLTKLRITEWYEHWGGKVYVSFSGGKDSTVLLTIARQLYPDIKAVYVDTGLEFPEVKQHVKTFDNVDILRPDKSFKQVIDEVGWVFPSKETAKIIEYANSGSRWALNALNGKKANGDLDGYKNRYKKWKVLLTSPFKLSSKCCEIMKEQPSRHYATYHNKKQIVGTMTVESARRKQAWIQTGCNAFDSKHPVSKPISFWTEQDVLQYIKDNNVAIPSVYGDVVEDSKGKLKTTGEDRTGCVYCLIGCHLEKGDRRRFVRLKQTHPKLYEYCMNKLGMKDILDYIMKITGRDDLY